MLLHITGKSIACGGRPPDQLTTAEKPADSLQTDGSLVTNRSTGGSLCADDYPSSFLAQLIRARPGGNRGPVRGTGELSG